MENYDEKQPLPIIHQCAKVEHSQETRHNFKQDFIGD